MALHPYRHSLALAHGTAIPLVRRGGPAIPVSAWGCSSHQAVVWVEETCRGVADRRRTTRPAAGARGRWPVAHRVNLTDSDRSDQVVNANRPAPTSRASAAAPVLPEMSQPDPEERHGSF